MKISNRHFRNGVKHLSSLVLKLSLLMVKANCRKPATLLGLFFFIHIFAHLPALAMDPWDSPEDGGVLLRGAWQLQDVPSLKFPDLNTAGTTVSRPDYAP